MESKDGKEKKIMFDEIEYQINDQMNGSIPRVLATGTIQKPGHDERQFRLVQDTHVSVKLESMDKDALGNESWYLGRDYTDIKEELLLAFINQHHPIESE